MERALAESARPPPWVAGGGVDADAELAAAIDLSARDAGEDLDPQDALLAAAIAASLEQH